MLRCCCCRHYMEGDLQALYTLLSRSQQSSATTWPALQKALKLHKEISDKIQMQQPHFSLPREVHINTSEIYL